MSLQHCRHCGRMGHSRITSKDCKLNAAYKSASPEGRARLIKRCRANRDTKRAKTPKRKEAMKIAAAKYNATLKRKRSQKRWKLQNACDYKSRNIAKESQAHGTYAANSRKFASCAAANIAQQVASHVNMDEEDVKKLLTPLQDSEILRIKKQWDLHIAKGANCQTCSTCGVIGLVGPREYSLQNPCINAFKVNFITTLSSCVNIKQNLGGYICG